jgi:hypothetical protein
MGQVEIERGEAAVRLPIALTPAIRIDSVVTASTPTRYVT